MCNGWGAPGNRTIGRGKMGSSRSMGNSIPKMQLLDAQTHRGEQIRNRGQECCPDPSTCSPLCVCASSSCRSSSCPPETLECPPVRRFPKFFERPLPDLPDPFARDSHQRADLFERHGLAAFFETIVEIEDLALAGGQVFLEDAV